MRNSIDQGLLINYIRADDKFIFVEYFIHTCLTLLKVQSFPIFYQLFYKQRPVKFSITVHITDTGTLKQTIFFTNISPSGENL